MNHPDYIEMTIEDAMKICNKKSKVLVAIKDLEKINKYGDVIEPSFVKRNEYQKLFKDIKTAAILDDNFIVKLQCFTEKQDIHNIKPRGKLKIVIL